MTVAQDPCPFASPRFTRYLLHTNTSLRQSSSSIFRTHFQVPYPASLVFATLTKTAGVCTNNSQLGTPSSSPFFKIQSSEKSPAHSLLTPPHFPLFTISLSPLSATLMCHLASVATKRLTPRLSPLNATLTKNVGGRPQLSLGVFHPMFKLCLCPMRFYAEDSCGFDQSASRCEFLVRVS